jgi:hypothetical protein
MKKYILILIFVKISFISGAELIVDKDTYFTLTGAWQINPLAERSQGDTLFIDLKGEIVDMGKPYFFGPIRGCDLVKARKIEDKKYLITILFVDNNNYDFIINLNDDGTIWFEKMGWFSKIQFLLEYGPEYRYYKVFGPENKDNPYLRPIEDNLRLRVSPNINAIIYRLLVKGDRLNLLKKGKNETIEGINGTWVQVRTEKGEVGWCFDAYLEEIK